MNKSKLFAALLLAYVLSLAFQDFMRLPGVFRKVQLPEILFLLLAVSFPFNYLRQYRFDKSDSLLMGVLGVYWLANAISSTISGKFSAIAESCGRLYLIVLFGMVTLYFAQLPKEELKRKTIKASILLGSLLALTSIGGLIAQLCGVPNMLVGLTDDYPYFGTIYRLQGFTHTPAMLVSLLSFTGIIAYYADLESKMPKNGFYTEGSLNFQKWTIHALSLMIIVSVLTFSRSNSFLFWGLALVFVIKKWGFSRNFFIGTTVLLALFMTVGTHIIFISKTSPALTAIYASPFTSNRILAEQGNYMALETSYLAIKRATIDVWQMNPMFGIGTGNFVNGLKTLQETGIYPQKLPIYEAHSTYLGTLAENGIFAAAAVVLLFGLLWSRINRFEHIKTDNFAAALLICMTTVIIEGIALDIMNFRHYWLLFALLWAYPKVIHTKKTEDIKF
jgi:O-Antigen ligase